MEGGTLNSLVVKLVEGNGIGRVLLNAGATCRVGFGGVVVANEATPTPDEPTLDRIVSKVDT